MTDKNYFGGHDARNAKHIRRLEVRNFKELVARYFDQAVPVNITRQAYLDLDKHTRDRLKSVAYITPCSFKDPADGRNNDNAKDLQLVAFDIDGEELGRQMFSSAAVVADQLEPYNFVLHTTANHREEDPRLRLVVDIETMPVEMHQRVIMYVASLLGVHDYKWKGIRETGVTSQPMFRPIAFMGESGSPVLVSRTSGRAMTEAEVPELPEGIADKNQRRYAEDFEGEESLEFLPLAVNLDQVREALKVIDASPYQVWCEVACGLRHQFRTDEDAEAAFEMYDEWSQTAGNYPSGGTDAVYAKWCSFKPYRLGRQPITIRTLFKFAIDAGWSNAKVVEQSENAFAEWLAACTTHTEVINGFAARIAGMPFPSAVMDMTLCEMAKTRYNELSPAKVQITSFLKQLKSDTRKPVFESADDKPPWLRPFVYVASSNTFCNTATMTEFRPEAFDRYFGHHLMPQEIEIGGSAKPAQSPCDYATNVKEIPKVISAIYDPRYAGTEPIFTKNGNTYLNTYKASYPEPNPATSKEAGAMFTGHITRLIREPEYGAILLDFCAFIVQHPGVKIRWAPVIQSVQGAGKGMIYEAMSAVLGEGNAKPVSNTIASSQWNDWCSGAQLIAIEEIHASGQNRKAMMDGLKEAISNNKLPINKRNTSAAYIDNTINLICFTNEECALSIDPGERRYFVLKSPIRTKAQANAMQAEGYFVKFATLHEDPNMAAGLRHFLLHHKISPAFNPNGNAPTTIYMQQMAEDSENDGLTLLRELIESNEHPLVCRHVIATSALKAHMGRDHAKPARYLRQLGYVKYLKRANIGGMTDLWVPDDYDADVFGEPADILRDRAAEMQREVEV